MTQGPVMGDVPITEGYNAFRLTRNMTKCPHMGGVVLLELQMYCLSVTRTMIQCPVEGEVPF